MKHGVSKWLILCSNCTKTHLRASVDQKNFLGSLSLAMRGGEGRKGEGEGEGKGRGGEGIMGGEWEGKGRGGGEGRRGGDGGGSKGRGREGKGGKGREWDPPGKNLVTGLPAPTQRGLSAPRRPVLKPSTWIDAVDLIELVWSAQLQDNHLPWHRRNESRVGLLIYHHRQLIIKPV
jgi:hypothetical protein